MMLSDNKEHLDVSIPYYCRSLDWDALISEYPPPPLYAQTTGVLSADALRHLQNTRFLARVADAWRLHWSAASDVVRPARDRSASHSDSPRTLRSRCPPR